MRINEELIKKFAMTGKDSKVTDGLAYGYALLIIVHGIIIAIFKQSVIFSILITLPFLLLFLGLFIYAKKMNSDITNGYNFLILSMGSFCLSITDLFASITLSYEKIGNTKFSIMLLFIYLLSFILFYLIFLATISKFNLKPNKKKSIVKPSIGVAGCVSVIVSVISTQIFINVSQVKLAAFFSFGFLFFAILWIFPTCLLIKFIYLKKKKFI